MKKKKIVFYAPISKGGTYYYYKYISEYFQKHYSDKYEVYFYNSLLNYIKIHFLKADILFSIVPVFFRPIRVKKFFFNLHWNYKIERIRRWVSIKLLYLSELNMWFSNKIILTSYYLADELDFRRKYHNKIEIIPIFTRGVRFSRDNKPSIEKTNLLTVTSVNYLQKWIGILDLAREISEIKNIQIDWHIVLPGESRNRRKILGEFDKITFPDTCNVKLFRWLNKKQLEEQYKNNHIFVYASNLDTWWMTIMEAMEYKMPIILYPNLLWKYIYPDNFVSWNISSKLNDIIQDYNSFSDEAYNFSKDYKLPIICKKIRTLI